MDERNVVKEIYWSRFATDYDARNRFVVGESEMDIFRHAVSEIGPWGRVLELACGNGMYSDIIAANAGELVATDYSDEMIEVAGKGLKSRPNVIVEKADAFALPYKSRSFDTVFAANLLHVVERPEAVLAEAGRVLKKGGRLTTLDMTLEGMTWLQKVGMACRYLKTYGKPPKRGRNFSLPQLQRLFLRSGLDILRGDLIGSKSKAVLMIGQKTYE